MAKSKKINPKNFTEEQAIEICLRQNQKCAICGKRASHITEEGDIVWIGNVHHIKPKSALTKAEIDELGPGGSTLNGVLVCQSPCHDFIHAMDPRYAKYRTKSWQKVGETEADIDGDS